MVQPVTNVQAYQFSYSIAANGDSTIPVWSDPSADPVYLSPNDCAQLYQMAKIKVVRTAINNGNQKINMEAMQAAYPKIKFLVLLIAYPNVAENWGTVQATWTSMNANIVWGFEGPNEMNQFGAYNPAGSTTTNNAAGTSTSFPTYVAWCQAVATYLAGSSKWNPTPGSKKYINGNVPTIAPSLANGPTTYSNWNTSSTPYYDYGCLHTYPKQCPGNANVVDKGGSGGLIADWNLHLNSIQPGKIMVASEFGHNTSTGASDPIIDWIDERTQAILHLNAWHDSIAYGSPLYCMYTITDTMAQFASNTDQEHYGVIKISGTTIGAASPKVAASAIHYIMTLIEDFNGSTFTPVYPSVSVTGLTNPSVMGNHLVIGRSDGSHFVAVWNEPKVWATNTASGDNRGAAVIPPNNNVVVNWGTPRNFKVHDPIAGTASALQSGSSTTINVLGYPLYIELQPGSSVISTGGTPVSGTHHPKKSSGNKLLLTTAGKMAIT